MDAKQKRKVIIVVSVGAILAVGGWLTWRHLKNKKAEKQRIADEAAAALLVSTQTQAAQTAQTAQTSVSDQPSDVKAFQDWMDAQGKPWILNKSTGKYEFLNKGAGYGNFGPTTQKVWPIFKDAFLAAKPSTVAPSGILKKLNDYVSGSISGVASDGRNYVRKDGEKGQYYWFEDRKFGLWNPDAKTWAATGFWEGDLAKVVRVTTGPNSGKTFTDENPVMAIYKASLDPAPPMSSEKAALYAEKLWGSMEGAGTVDWKFWETIKLITNATQWRQVYDKFGKRSGANLDEWINGDLEGQPERVKWNGEAKFRNIPLTLNTQSNTIKTKTV